jgi:16S rRNA (guanine527-N7)-methyltransferase
VGSKERDSGAVHILAPGQVPAEPPAAREIFGDRLELAKRYAGLLAGPGIERGLIGPGEVRRLWPRHILNCAVVAELVPGRCSLADIGSGAGLPGIVLAMLLPDVSVTLLEPLLRRSAFLAECVTELGLANTVVRRARAEDARGELCADVVTARAVAPLDRLAGWAMGLVRPRGTILAIKGDRAPEELRRAQGALKKLGASHTEILTVGRGMVEPETVVVRIVAGNGSLARRRPPDPPAERGSSFR